VSTVSPSTSATNKPRAGRLRITSGRVPRVPRTKSRAHLVIRREASPCGSAITSRPHDGRVPGAVRVGPTTQPRGGPPPRRATVMITTTATYSHPDTWPGWRVATTRKLDATCPHAGIPLGEEVDDRPRLLDAQAYASHVLVDLAEVEPAGQLEGVLLGVVAPPTGPQA